MAAEITLKKLQASPLFNKITPEQLVKLNPFFKMKPVAAGGTIFIENMRGESLYLIEKGTIKISRMMEEGDEQVLAVLGQDDVFGEMAVFDVGHRLATARVVEDASLFSLSREDYTLLADQDPKLCLQLTQNIIRIFSARIHDAQQEYRRMLLAALGRKS